MIIKTKTLQISFTLLILTASTVCTAQLSGEYDVIQYTPRGEKPAVLKIDSRGKGALTTERGTSEVKRLQVEGENFEFQAVVPTPFGESNSQWTGEAKGDELKATIKTKMGSFDAVGTKKEIGLD